MTSLKNKCNEIVASRNTLWEDLNTVKSFILKEASHPPALGERIEQSGSTQKVD